MVILKYISIITLTLWLGLSGALAQNQSRHVTISLIPPTTGIQAGQPFYIGIEQVIETGWHTYWRNAGDSGQAPRFTWTLPEGFTTGALQWPAPHIIRANDLTTFGYENNALLVQEIIPPASLPPGPLTVSVDIEILVCSDICVPEYGTYELTLPPPGTISGTEDRLAAALETLPVKAAGPAFMAEQNGQFILELPAPADIQTAPQDVQLFPYEWGFTDNAASASAVINEAGRLLITQKRAERPLSGIKSGQFLLVYKDAQGISRSLEIEAEPRPDSSVHNAVSPASLPALPVAEPTSLAKALIFALLGGLILNLMPCVFPVLSLKALKLCSLSGKELDVARHQSLLYLAGILASFAVFALILIAFKGVGAGIGWGFHLQNAHFVLFLCYLLFLLGLNLSGLYEISPRLMNFGDRFTHGHGHSAAFLTGVLAALVATPCTAPFMGVALGYTLTQPAIITLLIFLALGFGLALPYLMIAFVPALRNALPRPGAWMVTVRQLLAFPLYASAAWLLSVYMAQTGALPLLFILSGIIAVSFCAWLCGRMYASKGRRLPWIILGLAALAIALAPFFLTGAARPAPSAATTSSEGAWIPYTAESFALLEQGNDPLFVDMTAAWCITCKVNERVALNPQSTRDLFKTYNVILVRGDWTNRDPDITSYLARYRRNGVPLYVYYGPRNPVTGLRPDAVILPQILTPGLVRSTIIPKEI